jgi:RNA polymerase sigma-70 factor (ECF subfamily)
MEFTIERTGPAPLPPDAFAETRWSLVAAVQDGGRSGRESLAELCQSYWYPVFAYVRRCGHAPEIAYELTQSFFAYLLAELRDARPQEFGRFRNFLLARLNRFLVEDRHQPARSDDGHELPAPPALSDVEQRQQRELVPDATPERAFQRSFALELLAHGLINLRHEASQGGRIAMFERLEPYLTNEPGPGQYEVLAQALGTRPLAVVIAIKRLRHRFRELVDAELAQTVASGAELDAERDALLSILGRDR